MYNQQVISIEKAAQVTQDKWCYAETLLAGWMLHTLSHCCDKFDFLHRFWIHATFVLCAEELTSFYNNHSYLQRDYSGDVSCYYINVVLNKEDNNCFFMRSSYSKMNCRSLFQQNELCLDQVQSGKQQRFKRVLIFGGKMTRGQRFSLFQNQPSLSNGCLPQLPQPSLYRLESALWLHLAQLMTVERSRSLPAQLLHSLLDPIHSSSHAHTTDSVGFFHPFLKISFITRSTNTPDSGCPYFNTYTRLYREFDLLFPKNRTSNQARKTQKSSEPFYDHHLLVNLFSLISNHEHVQMTVGSEK